MVQKLETIGSGGSDGLLAGDGRDFRVRSRFGRRDLLIGGLGICVIAALSAGVSMVGRVVGAAHTPAAIPASAPITVLPSVVSAQAPMTSAIDPSKLFGSWRVIGGPGVAGGSTITFSDRGVVDSLGSFPASYRSEGHIVIVSAQDRADERFDLSVDNVAASPRRVIVRIIPAR